MTTSFSLFSSSTSTSINRFFFYFNSCSRASYVFSINDISVSIFQLDSKACAAIHSVNLRNFLGSENRIKVRITK